MFDDSHHQKAVTVRSRIFFFLGSGIPKKNPSFAAALFTLVYSTGVSWEIRYTCNQSHTIGNFRERFEFLQPQFRRTDSNFEKCLTLLSISNRVSILNICVKDIQWRKSELSYYEFNLSAGSLIYHTANFPYQVHQQLETKMSTFSQFQTSFSHQCVSPLCCTSPYRLSLRSVRRSRRSRRRCGGVCAWKFRTTTKNGGTQSCLLENVRKCNKFGAMLYLLKYDWIRRV